MTNNVFLFKMWPVKRVINTSYSVIPCSYNVFFFKQKKNWELKWASAVYSVPSSFRWSIEFWNIKEIIYHNNYTSNWCFVCVLIIYRKWTLFDIERYILHVYSGIYVLCFTNPEHTLLSLGSWTINMKLSVPFRLGNIPREL